MSRCSRAIAGQTCVTLMASFGLIATMSPPPLGAVGLVILGIAAGVLNGSLHDACREA